MQVIHPRHNLYTRRAVVDAERAVEIPLPIARRNIASDNQILLKMHRSLAHHFAQMSNRDIHPLRQALLRFGCIKIPTRKQRKRTQRHHHHTP